jgi:hypothetical protein
MVSKAFIALTGALAYRFLKVAQKLNFLGEDQDDTGKSATNN